MSRIIGHFAVLRAPSSELPFAMSDGEIFNYPTRRIHQILRRPTIVCSGQWHMLCQISGYYHMKIPKIWLFVDSPKGSFVLIHPRSRRGRRRSRPPGCGPNSSLCVPKLTVTPRARFSVGASYQLYCSPFTCFSSHSRVSRKSTVIFQTHFQHISHYLTNRSTDLSKSGVRILYRAWTSLSFEIKIKEFNNSENGNNMQIDKTPSMPKRRASPIPVGLA
ncbi:hypothetical protein EVAR_2972_1 [Eumeta japonica]|uniref:Uncharacterized protein n=1 Tax=Eumeta variegata TaxID=151549 RepID=A0A4C1SWN4_EUMVA|nr:hypothetical protein EVAR_2972_1 [Eumeta japonica]